MKKHIQKFTAALVVVGAITTASAQNAFTWNGFNFVAGLANVTDASALHSNATEISYLTDTNIYTLVGNMGFSLIGGHFAGDFGGGSYSTANSNGITLVGYYEANQNMWGTFNVSLQLSDGSYTSTRSYGDANLVDAGLTTAALNIIYNENQTLDLYPAGSAHLGYLSLSIADFYTGNLGVTGIQISSITSWYPDISYIGVTGPAIEAGPNPVPEPSTMALAALGGLSLLLYRRRK